jgi:hypothetical protein
MDAPYREDLAQAFAKRLMRLGLTRDRLEDFQMSSEKVHLPTRPFFFQLFHF